jgi:hypothetical protein
MLRNWAARGWGQAKTASAPKGNLAVGIALGSGHQNQIQRMDTTARTNLANDMKAAGVTWVRMDAEWWTVQKYGMSLDVALTAGNTYTSIVVRSTTVALTLTAGDVLTMSDLAGHIQQVTVASTTATSTGGTTTVSVSSFVASRTWADLSTKLGQPPDWSTIDPIVTDFVAAGLNIVMLLNKASGWCQRPANTAPLYSPYTTPDPKLYGVFCAAAVAHYMPMGVEVYELWNEANLSSGTGSDGWAYLAPLGLAELSIEAYAAIKAQNPAAYVLSGSLATASKFGTAGSDKTCSWSAVTEGATSATVTCATAAAGDAPGFLYDALSAWPVGTIITAASTGVSYTVAPPPWSTGGFPAISSSGGATLRVQNSQLAPDYFLDQMYAAAGGAPMFDALAIHPYTQPVLPGAHLAIYGGWASVPNMRASMIANGDATKPMWITEVGAPSGTIASASWSSALSSATSLTVSSTQAKAADVQYGLTATGIPANCWIDLVTTSSSWRIRPPTGATLSTALVEGVAVTSITVSATPAALTIPSGTVLNLVVAPASNVWATTSLAVTTTADATTSTSTTTSISISSVTPGFPLGTTTRVQAAVGQTFGASISSSSSATVSIVPPGVPTVAAQVDEATQAQIITAVFQAVTRGAASAGSGPGASAWPYVGPIFIYCWTDSNAGGFGLMRGNGTTAKPALAAMSTAIAKGG